MKIVVPSSCSTPARWKAGSRGYSQRQMLRSLGRSLAVAAVLMTISPAAAGALTVEGFGGLESPAAGVAVGPDGNTWAAEQLSGSVVRMSPSGQVINRYPVGSKPTLVTNGPNGTVWVAVTGADKLT